MLPPRTILSARSASGATVAGTLVPELTAEEQRLHQGGQGAKRMERKQKRVQDWLQGQWRPAWLEEYLRGKAQREAARVLDNVDTATGTSESSDADSQTWTQDPATGWSSCTSSGTSLSSSTWSSWSSPQTSLVPSWEGWEQWLSWHSPWDEVSSTSSSTSTTTFEGVLPAAGLPNEGLFPTVREADYLDLAGSLELTGAERRRLQEVGVPGAMIDRLADIFQGLNSHQLSDRGPEGRWAPARFARRAEEGLQALDILLELVTRRLVPRGHWPVQLEPATEGMRWNLFQWARSTSRVFQSTLEHHLSTPLQPDEHRLNSTEQHAPNEVTDAAGSQKTAPLPEQMGARDRSRSPLTRAEENSESSERTSDATEVVEPTPPALPSGVQRALAGELLGVWAEPATSSSTSTSTTLHLEAVNLSGEMVTCDLSSSSSQSPLEALEMDVATEDFSLAQLYIGVTLSSSSSTTTTSTQVVVWPAEVVRDTVNHQLVHAGDTDVLELLHRLLDRQRHLQHCQRLLLVAIEETLRWIQVPPNGEALNANIHENHIWSAVVAEAAHGSGPSTTSAGTWINAPVVMLTPDLPRDLPGLMATLPSVGAHSVAGYRRRAWRNHVAALYDAAGLAPPAVPGPEDADGELLLLQGSPTRPIGNWPAADLLPRHPRDGRFTDPIGRRRVQSGCLPALPVPGVGALPVPGADSAGVRHSVPPVRADQMVGAHCSSGPVVASLPGSSLAVGTTSVLGAEQPEQAEQVDSVRVPGEPAVTLSLPVGPPEVAPSVLETAAAELPGAVPSAPALPAEGPQNCCQARNRSRSRSREVPGA